MVPGTGPEEHVPADVLDNPLKKEILSRRISQIGSPDTGGVDTPDAKDKAAAIEDKMKGPKKY